MSDHFTTLRSKGLKWRMKTLTTNVNYVKKETMARNLFETMNNCACLVRRKILQRYCTIAVCIYFHVGTFITNCSFIVFEYQMAKCGMRQLFSKNVKHKRISFYSAFQILEK